MLRAERQKRDERPMTADTPKDLADSSAADSSQKASSSDRQESEPAAALDELEAEELEMLTEDEAHETLVVDEAAEMRAIRRAEISMEGQEVDAASSDEFVCSSCFLVKCISQLAVKRKKICFDCAS